MSGINLKPSQRAGVVGVISPQSATAVQVTGWLDATVFHNYLAILGFGNIAATATVDAKIQQATDNAGAGAKDVTGKAITQLVDTDDNKQALINLKQEDLDFNNGFKWFQVSITPATALALIQATVLGFDPRFGFASDTGNAATTQAQVV